MAAMAGQTDGRGQMAVAGGDLVQVGSGAIM